MTNAKPLRRFDIALSFPGEHRRFVKPVAIRLAEVLGKDRVFYDEWYEAELLGLDGDLKLRRYYREESVMVVPFFSEHYGKDWCQIEWSSIRAMLKDRRKEDAVIPVQMDLTSIPGWESIDFAIRRQQGSKNRNAKQIADLIIEAYRLRFQASAAPQDGRRSDETRTVRKDQIPADIDRIVKYAPSELIGREAETALLNDAWAKVQSHATPRPHVLTFVALGGEGKTSLVAKWAADLAANDWPGCEAVFAWSFYSQGTREQNAASSDLFLNAALNFFGDEAMANSPSGAFEKGQRLARIVGQQRALLILDGLEPLQYSPTSPTAGELKDQGLAALLKGLATTNKGLCVATTRYRIPDLRAYWQNTAPMHDLPRLSKAAGVKLLRTIGVKGAQAEFETLVEDVDGHALTLQIFGQFLVRAFGGDIRKRDRVKLEKADAKIQGGHAFRAMAAYEKWMEDDSDEARRELAILKLLGLFDRPATADCLAALLQAPAIPGLTEPLVGLPEEDLQFSLTALRDAKLITFAGEAAGFPHSSFNLPASIDAHPLLREYFSGRLKAEGGMMKEGEDSSFRLQNSSFQLAHRRLYEHLCATTKEGDQPTLEDLQPLYQAVAHGCQAGLQQETFRNVFRNRLDRQNAHYATTKLGAYGSHLGAISHFFEHLWTKPVKALDESDRAFVLQGASFCLGALGRLTESLAPIRAAANWAAERNDWDHAAIGFNNLSEWELALGKVAEAVEDAEQSVSYADRSGDADWQNYIRTRTAHAAALHQAGRRDEAKARFLEAEQMQAGRQPNYPLLYSLPGFRYCDLLLAEAERAAGSIADCGLRIADCGFDWCMPRRLRARSADAQDC